MSLDVVHVNSPPVAGEGAVTRRVVDVLRPEICVATDVAARGLDVDDLEVGLEQLDRRQDAVAVQPGAVDEEGRSV